uniref:Protocadherin-10-like n=1 Tax=Hippocampus comes TaxID=109280 RepID=A0A3Q2YMV2_HIPCM
MARIRRPVCTNKRWRSGPFVLALVTFWCRASAQIRYSISEEAKAGSVVGNVAKDLGLDRSALKTRDYRIVGSGAEPLFHVNADDGVLYVSRKVDREEVYGGRPARSGTIDIIVAVLDFNDNAPVFTKDVYSAVLNENAPAGTLVMQVNATDLDEGENGEIIYLFGKEGDAHLQELFNINPKTGEIKVAVMTKSHLDREEK